jgi:hypothetical protein
MSGMSEDTGRSRQPRRSTVMVVVGVLGVLAAVGAFVVARGGDGETRDGQTRGGASGLSLPDDVLSAPGTELPDGFAVAPGSSLIGPVVVDEVDAAGGPTSWSAVLAVDGDPLTVWRAYVEQIAGLFPEEGLDLAQTPGCPSGEGYNGEVCQLGADTVDGQVRRSAVARLVSIPGDVTGGYLLRLEAETSDRYPTDIYGDGEAPSSRSGPLPEPNPARPRPDVGEPLAPDTVAYDGDNDEYVLLEGSELIAQYSAGSLTGGFGVVLRTAPGAQLDTVAGAYAEQAVQFEGEPVPPPEVVEHDGTTVTVYLPPGGAGGYTGTVTAVDPPTGPDYIFYELDND